MNVRRINTSCCTYYCGHKKPKEPGSLSNKVYHISNNEESFIGIDGRRISPSQIFIAAKPENRSFLTRLMDWIKSFFANLF